MEHLVEPHVESNLPLDRDAKQIVERCAVEYRRWLASMAGVYARQRSPDAISGAKCDVVAARSATLTWMGMAMGEMVVSGDDTFLHQFRALNSMSHVPDDD